MIISGRRKHGPIPRNCLETPWEQLTTIMEPCGATCMQFNAQGLSGILDRLGGFAAGRPQGRNAAQRNFEMQDRNTLRCAIFPHGIDSMRLEQTSHILGSHECSIKSLRDELYSTVGLMLNAKCITKPTCPIKICDKEWQARRAQQ